MLLRHVNLKTVSIWATIAVAALIAGYWYLKETSDAKAYELAGEAARLQQAGDLVKARLALTKAIAIRDDVPDFYLQLGRVSFQLGDRTTAFASYDVATSLAPQNTEALLAVAQIGLQVGERQKSKEATRRLLLNDPRFVEARLVNGVHHMLGRDYDEAIEEADAVLAIEPDHTEAVILKIRASVLNDDEQAARSLLRAYASERSDSPPLALTELEVYREFSDADGMIAAFGKLRTLLPKSANLSLDEAVLHYQLGQSSKATDIVSQALALDDVGAEEIGALVRVLRLYASTPDIVRASQVVGRSGNVDARVELARLLLQRDEVGVATELMKDLRGNEASVFAASRDLALGRSVEALNAATAIVEVDSTNCTARYVQARAHHEHKDFNKAIYAAQRATGECPTLVEGWSVLASAYDEQGKSTQSDRVFEQAISENPQEPWLTHQYVDWLIERGEPRKALAVQRTLARAMPGYAPAWRKYLQLCGDIDPACVKAAKHGLELSTQTYGIDPPPGERSSSGLFGRFLIR
ncbi:tetratricopeptide repeat protein [Qipengyuania sphaerica]|uniref:tetratricopeptide repeat protein n=1 Tax=Qipengyuania sphaerica TaxID=2867243 RepID=UPI001FFD2A9E|nr:tetratricopeptide repeat protein [Qipengyuania sphaerica]